MAEIPKWFPRDIEELYRLNPGEAPSINDPRVATSHGGGVCPVQHWGILDNDRVFYFRYRHGGASVRLAPHWVEPGELPARDVRTTWEAWDEAYERGDDPLPPLWLGPGGHHQVTEEDDGWFSSQDELDEAFRIVLDQVYEEPFDVEGWEAWRKEQGNQRDN